MLDKVLDWALGYPLEIFDSNVYWIFFLFSIVWLFIGVWLSGRKHKEFRGKSSYKYIAPIIIAIFPVVWVSAIILAGIFIVSARWVFDSANFFIAYMVILVAWVKSRFTAGRLYKIIDETLRPWVIGLSILIAVYLITYWCIPKTDWKWLFSIEKAASQCEIFFERFLPASLWANLILLIFIALFNIFSPGLRNWSALLQLGLTKARTYGGILAVLTTFTFFGSGMSGALRESTANEKYERLKDKTTEASDLILAARLTEQSDKEVEDITVFLDVVYAGVLVDEKIGPSLDDFNGRITDYASWRRSYIRGLVEKRVSELREALAKSSMTKTVARKLDDTLLAKILEKEVSRDALEEAKTKFEDALELIVKGAVKLSTHPLSVMLNDVGVPLLVQEVVKDLYKEKAVSLSKELTTPLADTFFRGPNERQESDINDIKFAAAHPVFDGSLLPPEVLHPTYEYRLTEKLREQAVRKAVREATRKAR